MENQHRKIVGYRELTQDDIDLMNRIKAAGRELLVLHDAVVARIKSDRVAAETVRREGISAADQAEQETLQGSVDHILSGVAEPERWAAIAKTDLQTGVMALVRAVAQPTDC